MFREKDIKRDKMKREIGDRKEREGEVRER